MFLIKKLLVLALTLLLVISNTALAFATDSQGASPYYLHHVYSSSSGALYGDMISNSSGISSVTISYKINNILDPNEGASLRWKDSSGVVLGWTEYKASDGLTAYNKVVTPPAGTCKVELVLGYGPNSSDTSAWISYINYANGDRTIYPTDPSAPPLGPIVPVSLTISPSTVNVGLGQSVNFTATMHYSDGSTQDVTSGTTFTSSDPSKLAINGNTGTGTGTGPVTVTGSNGGFSNSTTGSSVTMPTAPTGTVPLFDRIFNAVLNALPNRNYAMHDTSQGQTVTMPSVPVNSAGAIPKPSAIPIFGDLLTKFKDVFGLNPVSSPAGTPVLDASGQLSNTNLLTPTNPMTKSGPLLPTVNTPTTLPLTEFLTPSTPQILTVVQTPVTQVPLSSTPTGVLSPSTPSTVQVSAPTNGQVQTMTQTPIMTPSPIIQPTPNN